PGLSFCAFTILQGPLQIIHFSQLLQGFHLKPNEEFDASRFARHIRNMHTGQAQRSRLSYIGNKYADRIERRMVDRAGLRSVYDGTTGKPLGYEIVNEAKARDHVRDFRRDGIQTRANAPGFARGPKGEQITGRFIDFTNADDLTKKLSIMTIWDANRIGRFRGIATRTLITRAGLDFHPLHNIKRKAGQKFFDYKRERDKARAEEIKNGADLDTKRLSGEGSEEGNEFADEASKADTPTKKFDLVK